MLRFPQFRMLQIEDLFLSFYLSPQLFFSRKAQTILCSKKLLISMKDRISSNILVRLRTKNNAQRWIVALSSF